MKSPTKWPRWVQILIGCLLILLIAFLAVIIRIANEPTPVIADATPTPSVFQVNATWSSACTDCHTDKEQLTAAGASAEVVEAVYVDPASTELLHGKLGCVTCHQGTHDTAEADAAHVSMVTVPASDINASCLTCHESQLVNEYPDDKLIAPHEVVLSGTTDLVCTNCHTMEGHAASVETTDVVISMSACLDCHLERQLEIQQEDCLSCHTEMPTWTADMDCNSCHTTAAGTTYAATMEDSNLLASNHATLGLTCLDCHQEADLAVVHNGGDTSTIVDISSKEFCFSCHVDNNHASYDEIRVLTEDAEDEYGANPHNSHNGKIDCSNCHMVHEESTDYCSTCHNFGWTVP